MLPILVTELIYFSLVLRFYVFVIGIMVSLHLYLYYLLGVGVLAGLALLHCHLRSDYISNLHCRILYNKKNCRNAIYCARYTTPGIRYVFFIAKLYVC